MQGAVDLDEKAGKLSPFPQIVVVQHDPMQFYIAVEKQILLESDSTKDSIIDLISVYFTFDIAYPKLLYPVCLFLQHYVLVIVDKQLFQITSPSYFLLWINVTGFGKTLRMRSARDSRNARF